MYNQFGGQYWDGQKWVASAPSHRRASVRGIQRLLVAIMVAASLLAAGAALVLANSGQAGEMLQLAGLGDATSSPSPTSAQSPPSNRSQP
jgi:hypothetical protein